LLFAGFDKGRRAHIFSITECGRITFHDAVGYAAIGGGALRALLSVSALPFAKRLPLSLGIWGILAAKFAAESADGVGEETVLTILEPCTRSSPVFDEYQIKKLRTMWENLPRFPSGDEPAKRISGQLTMFQTFGFLGQNCRPTPSVSEKLENWT
jgi:hypothetical protein